MGEPAKVLPMNGAKPVEATPEEKPVFDFSRTSYKEQRLAGRWTQELSHLNKRIAALPAEEDITPLLDKVDELEARIAYAILGCVVSVPRLWLIPGAPEVIDWQNKDADALQWLRADKFAVLATAGSEARDAKN
jgi:hypothetical protein